MPSAQRVRGGRVTKATKTMAKKDGSRYFLFHVNSCRGVEHNPDGTVTTTHAWKSGTVRAFVRDFTKAEVIAILGIPPEHVTGLTLVEITAERYKREEQRLANKGPDHKDWLFPL